MANVTVAAQSIGRINSTEIYRVDLAQAGLGSIQSITFLDDSTRSGGSGGASGLDLDFVKLSATGTLNANTAINAATIPGLDFTSGNVDYRPGYSWQWLPGETAAWNVPNFFGTTAGNVYSPNNATLATRDGSELASAGTLSLGEGGQITFLLTSAVQSGNYLYFGDSGSIDLTNVILSDVRAAPAYTGTTVRGEPANDYIAFGVGVNAHVGAGADNVDGKDGNDTIYTAGGNDTAYGGSGNDLLFGEAGSDLLLGEEGDDQVYGGSENDKVYGGTGNDLLFGETGDDFVFGGFGNEKLYGGVGHDSLDGEEGNDLLYGEANNDKLYGALGNDKLYGGAGHDKLYGGLGNDHLYGGAGKDAFVFSFKPHKTKNWDRIFDFNVKDDSVYLENSVFKVGKGTEFKPRKIDKDMFTIGKKAADKEDRIIYDNKTGVLFYDVDGTGSKAMVKIGMLKKGLKMTYNDFYAI